MFGVGLPEASLTVAVTQCSSPALFVSVGGVSTSVAGAADPTHAFVAVAFSSATSQVPLVFPSWQAVIVSLPTFVPV